MSGPIVLVLRLLLAAALYAFLAVALWVMWQDLSRATQRAGRRKVRPIRLEVRTRQRQVQVRSFAKPEVVLGRDPLADVPLTDEAVSAHHARLSFHHGQWWLDDLGSRNGTRLNKERLTGPTVLTSGDEIKCGRSRVTVILDTGLQGANSTSSGVEDG